MNKNFFLDGSIPTKIGGTMEGNNKISKEFDSVGDVWIIQEVLARITYHGMLENGKHMFEITTILDHSKEFCWSPSLAYHDSFRIRDRCFTLEENSSSGKPVLDAYKINH